MAREPSSGVKYTVCRVRSLFQVEAPTRDEALRLARLIAGSAAVDLWYDEGPSYRLLEAYRGCAVATRPLPPKHS